jgi:hypothetical protein
MYVEADEGLATLAATLTGLNARLDDMPAPYAPNPLCCSGLAIAELLLLYAAALTGLAAFPCTGLTLLNLMPAAAAVPAASKSCFAPVRKLLRIDSEPGPKYAASFTGDPITDVVECCA